MKSIEVPFASQAGSSKVEQNSRETLINMFAEIETSGINKIIRNSRVGVRSVLALAGQKRCIEFNKGVHYLVAGSTVYAYDGSLRVLGQIGSTTGRCTMVFNDNDEILISDGIAGYWSNGVQILPVNSETAIGPVAYHSGYALFSVPGTGQFYTMRVNDFSTVDALDFATAESYTDNIVRVFVDHSEVWLFGETSSEIWQLSGGLDFPFSRFSNAQLERGCLAPFSVAAEDNTVFWLGNDSLFYRADGYSPLVISTSTVADLIKRIPENIRKLADAFCYTDGINKFYTVSFPGYLTLQYNIRTGLWNIARSFGAQTWDVLGSAGHDSNYFLTKKGLVSLERGLAQDEGGIIERGGVSPTIWNNGERFSVRSYFLDCEVGRASVNDEIRVMMRVARDGETFENQLWRGLGKAGDYRRRAVWRNLGHAREFTFEFLVTDPYDFSVIDARMVAS